MNLDDGQNIVTKEKFSVGDSALLDTKKDKIVKVLPLKEGATVEIIIGKHAGEKGKLEGFEVLTRGKNYIVKLEDKTVSLPYKTILVIA
jgi:ribosomal protein S4E